MLKLKKNEAFTAEREREIRQVIFWEYSFSVSSFFCLQDPYDFDLYELPQVVESVNELAQIMKDLSVLVVDQVGRCYLQQISLVHRFGGDHSPLGP